MVKVMIIILQVCHWIGCIFYWLRYPFQKPRIETLDHDLLATTEALVA